MSLLHDIIATTSLLLVIGILLGVLIETAESFLESGLSVAQWVDNISATGLRSQDYAPPAMPTSVRFFIRPPLVLARRWGLIGFRLTSCDTRQVLRLKLLVGNSSACRTRSAGTTTARERPAKSRGI